MERIKPIRNLIVALSILLIAFPGVAGAEEGPGLPAMLDSWLEAINGAMASNVLDFSDLMLLSMAFPNMIALYALSGKVKSRLDAYLLKLRTGELDREAGLG